MADKRLYEKTVFGLIWQCAEKFGTQLVTFVLQIILARLLTPEDYGIVGIISVFISIALVFAQAGMGQALVQKKNADENDYCTVMVFSVVVGFIGYTVLFALAGFIASMYGEPVLRPVIRVLGITVVTGAVLSVLQARAQKNMEFKKLFYANFFGAAGSAPVGIYMAYSGLGVWALAISQIAAQVTSCTVLIIVSKYKLSGRFSFERMKRLFSYSSKLLCSTLLDTIYDNIYSLIIGKKYSTEKLGYYSRGKQFPVLIIQNANAAMDGVLFPVLSKLQDEREVMKAAIRRAMRLSTYIVFPLMTGLAAVAEPLVRVLLTDKWLPVVPFLRFYCFIFALWPIHTANLQAIKALGKSDIFLRQELAKKAVSVTILLLAIPHGLMAIMWGKCVGAVAGCGINAFPNRRLLGYKFSEQLRDILPALIMSVMIPAAILPMGGIAVNDIILIGIEVIIGAAVYVGLSLIFRSDSFKYLLKMLKELKGGKRI